MRVIIVSLDVKEDDGDNLTPSVALFDAMMADHRYFRSRLHKMINSLCDVDLGVRRRTPFLFSSMTQRCQVVNLVYFKYSINMSCLEKSSLIK